MALELLNTRQAALLLGLRPATLRWWRSRGKGPAFIRVGDSKYGRAMYEREELERWVAEHRNETR